MGTQVLDSTQQSLSETYRTELADVIWAQRRELEAAARLIEELGSSAGRAA